MRKLLLVASMALSVPLAATCGTLAGVLSTPCETEDGVNCIWQADVQGNGRGHSFVSIRFTDGAEPRIFYIN